MDLPGRIPLFPLANAVLFPYISLPLHIFEPRYREMVRDCGRESGIIGMTLLKGDWKKEYYGNPEIFPIGCAGKMVRVAPLADGRCNILLHGLREYRVTHETFAKSYRQAAVEWRPLWVKERLDTIQRSMLIQLAEEYLQQKGALQHLLAGHHVEDVPLINFLCFHLDLSSLEKQSLLEADSLVDRTQRLSRILDFKIEERRWRISCGDDHGH